MAKTRILLTGADSLTGSHILAQLLSHDVISVRAVVNSREAAYTLHQQYRQTSFSLDVVTVSDRDLKVPGALEDVLSDLSEPFHAVVHTLTANPSDEADCLARFINLETETTIRFLSAVQEVARVVGRVVIVTSLSPFAQWLVDPQVDREAGTDINGHSDSPTTDLEYVLATSQASNNIVSDAVMKWMKESDAPFDVAYVTAPSVYGPTVYPLETSSDLAETNRQIWNICSSEPRERTEMPPYGITHFADVRVRQPIEHPASMELTFCTGCRRC
jgi:nucleoside-diphosphate-sugar epimerase